jgi:hypothetical protein
VAEATGPYLQAAHARGLNLAERALHSRHARSKAVQLPLASVTGAIPAMHTSKVFSRDGARSACVGVCIRAGGLTIVLYLSA